MSQTGGEAMALAPWLKDGTAQSRGLSVEKSSPFLAAMERFVETAGEAVAEIVGSGAAATLESVESASVFELLGAHTGHPAAVVYSTALDARLAAILDPAAIDLIVNAAFGGGAATRTPSSERRPTAFELRLAGEAVKRLLEDLSRAFAPVVEIDFEMESFSAIADTSLLGPRDSPATAVNLSIRTAAGPLNAILVFPAAASTAILDKFAGDGSGEDAASETIWSRGLQREVVQARMTVTAILDEFALTLGEIAAFEPGLLLPLSGEGEGRIRLDCAERGVLVCKLGERFGRYALEVQDFIAAGETAPVATG